MIRNDPTSLYFDAGTTGTGLSFDELSRRLPIEWLPAANCPDGMCAVGRLKNYEGFIEAVGPMNDLRRARVTFPLFGPNFKIPENGTRPDTTSEEYLRYGALGLRLVANVIGDKALDDELPKTTSRPPSPGRAIQFLAHMRMMSMKCGAGSTGMALEKRHVWIRSLNEKYWVAIDVLPSPPSAQQSATPKRKRK